MSDDHPIGKTGELIEKSQTTKEYHVIKRKTKKKKDKQKKKNKKKK